MKKKTKTILTILLIAGAVFGVGFAISKIARRPRFKRDKNKEEELNKEAEEYGLPDITWRDDSFPLGLGSRGERVMSLQSWINSPILNPDIEKTIEVDGYWGYETEQAVEKYLGVDTVDASLFADLGLTTSPKPGELEPVLDPTKLV